MHSARSSCGGSVRAISRGQTDTTAKTGTLESFFGAEFGNPNAGDAASQSRSRRLPQDPPATGDGHA